MNILKLIIITWRSKEMMRKNKIYEKLLEIVNKNYGLMKLMKLSFVIAIVALAYFAMPAAAEANIVSNPGFESGTTAPLNWRLMTKDGNVPAWDDSNVPAWDSTVFHTGSRSIKISIPGTTSGYSGKAESDFMYVEPGQNYTFSAWVKTQDTGGNPPIVTVVEADANTNWLRSTRLTFGTGTNDWSQQVIDFQTGPDTAILYVTAKISNGYGTFWVDDISISPKDATTSTPTPTPTSAPLPDSQPTPVPTPIPAATSTQPISSSGKIYYVAKNGNDNNLGTELSPWLTIQKAANTAKAGDTVYVKAGTYIEQVNFPNSGTAGNYITFQNYSTDTVILKPPVKEYTSWSNTIPVHHSGHFEIIGESYIIIKGFNFLGNGGNAKPDAEITIEQGANNIIIDGNIFDDIWSSAVLAGYFASGGNHYGAWDIVFTNNYVRRPNNGGWVELMSYDNVNRPIISHNEFVYQAYGECLDYKEGTENGIISYNRISNCYNPIMGWTGGLSAGIYVDGYRKGVNNISVFNNIVEKADYIGVGSECGGLAQNIKFYNNILIGGYQGYSVHNFVNSKCTGQTAKYYNINFINNIAYNTVIPFRIQKSQSDIIVRNNIKAGTGSNSIATGVTVDHNSWNLGITDPKFVNAIAYDFHLQSSSSAIDSGSSVSAPSTDFDGNIRPKRGGYDIGAFEY